jgi:hypothetical protein
MKPLDNDRERQDQDIITFVATASVLCFMLLLSIMYLMDLRLRLSPVIRTVREYYWIDTTDRFAASAMWFSTCGLFIAIAAAGVALFYRGNGLVAAQAALFIILYISTVKRINSLPVSD